MKTCTMTLTGADGQRYLYTLDQHPAGEGLELFARLMVVSGGSLGNLLASLGLSQALPRLVDKIPGLLEKLPDLKDMGADEAGKQVIGMLLQADLGQVLREVFEGVDEAQLGEGLGRLAGAFLREGGSSLCRQLLAYTTRAPQSQGAGVKLSNATSFDQAYQGNYGELLRAVGWAFWCNFACMVGRDPFAQG